MAIRMLVTDLDGTLLNRSFQISPKNKEALQAAAAKGVMVTLATGRMYRSARPYAVELGLDAPIITYNGAVIQSTGGETLFSSCLEAGTAAAVMQYCFQRRWYVQLYQGDNLYYAAATPAALAYEKSSGVKGLAVGQKGMLARTTAAPKLLAVAPDPSRTDVMVAELAEVFSGKIAVMKSNPLYIEVIAPGVSKAAAMLSLAAEYGIRADVIMALGDSNNDLSMLRAAGLGIAMGNAAESVQRIADAVTTECESGGVADAVYRYVL